MELNSDSEDESEKTSLEEDVFSCNDKLSQSGKITNIYVLLV